MFIQFSVWMTIQASIWKCHVLNDATHTYADNSIGKQNKIY